MKVLAIYRKIPDYILLKKFFNDKLKIFSQYASQLSVLLRPFI